MARFIRGVLIAGLMLIVVVVPAVYYRSLYAHSKRLREVVPGQFYRSGQLTAAGFTDAVRDLGIRTIINVQDDVPDPDLWHTFWDRRTVKESDLCRTLGVRFVQISPGLLTRDRPPPERPAAIDQFLAVMDNPGNYPVLLHCRAGLHRTGLLTAIYRMEYQGWSHDRAFREMRDHGFGPWACSAANDYVSQYVLSYRPGMRRPGGVALGPD